MRRFFVYGLTIALLAACSAPKADVPVYVWHLIGNNTVLDSLQKDFQAWKSHGVTGVCIETRSMEQIEQVAALAQICTPPTPTPTVSWTLPTQK